MARILYLCPRVPYPPTDGSRIRMYNTANILNRKHQVELLIVNHNLPEKHISELKNTFSDVHTFGFGKYTNILRNVTGIFSRKPLQAQYFHLNKVQRWIHNRSSEYDLIFSYLLRMGEYLKALDSPKIMDFGDAYSKNYKSFSQSAKIIRSAIYALEGKRMLQYEREMLQETDRAIITTKKDMENLGGEKSIKSKVTVIPNGVNNKVFNYNVKHSDKVPILTFLGAMDYYPNIRAVLRFCDDIFPKIKKENEEVEFHIVGKNPTRKVRKLSKRKGVTVTGYVENPFEILSESVVFVAPIMHGGGIQNKILEAMGVGLPVVTSELGASGIDAIPGEHLLIAKSPNEFIEKTNSLLDDSCLRKQIGVKARELVSSKYTWEVIATQLFDTVSETINSHQSLRRSQ